MSLPSPQLLRIIKHASINSSFSLEFMQFPAASCVYADMSSDTADTLDHLPDDPVVLKRMLAELLEALHRRDHELQQVQARLDQVLRRLYGPRAERYDPQQPLLFAAPAAVSAATPAAASAPTAGPEADAPARRSGHGRQRLPAHLVREPRVYELTEVERRCPRCGDARAVLGQETCEQRDFVPASLRII